MGTPTIIVQKYGGSSVADLERLGRVADKIVATENEGHRVVVVVSAMGKTTDGLIAQARQVDASPPRRELDMLVSTGERVSMALLSIAIQKRGREAISFTGSQAGIITDDRHFDARIVAVRPQRVLDELERDRIVIVAGYQGVSERKEITTLGRGGSDTTAVALAAALGAERCEIYSDVDGVYSADPRVVPDALHVAELDHETLQTAAEAGAKVLNAQAVEWARREGIAIYARHTGQTYSGKDPAEGARQSVVSSSPAAPARRRFVVAGERGLVIATFRAESVGEALRALGEAAAKADVAPREVSVDATGAAVAIFSLLNAPDWSRARASLAASLGAHLREGGLREGVGAATAVGDGLTSVSGPFGGARLAALVSRVQAPLHAALLGPLRVTLLTDEGRVDDLVRGLHEDLAAG